MELQSACGGISISNLRFTTPANSTRPIGSSIQFGARYGRAGLGSLWNSGSKSVFRRLGLRSLNRGCVVRGSSSNSGNEVDISLKLPEKNVSVLPATGSFNGFEPFRGKSGSVSFCGLTHQNVEEERSVSAPLKADAGSFLWTLGPVVLISSLIVPQFFIGPALNGLLKDAVLVEMVTSLSFEAVFYIGLSVFLRITDRVQKPYLEFSSKCWGLITGLRGYFTSSFSATWFKVIAPLLVAYITWPVVGVVAPIAVIPYIAGCISQRVFEVNMKKRGSSCWPLVTIIFEIYRIYQLTKAAHFIEKLLYSMRGLPNSPELMERSRALLSMVAVFQVVGVVGLWSLITFLMRLFPSRPVAEKY